MIVCVFITIKWLYNFINVRVMLNDNLKAEAESTGRGQNKNKRK